MADTVPAWLEEGEFVIRKDAVDEIGLPVLKMLNQADRMQEFNEGGSVMGQNGHSAIDELIALNELGSFSQGGIVKEGMQGYQQGGKVIKGYQQGGKVKNLDSLYDALSKKRGIEFFMRNYDSEPKKQMYQDAVLSGKVEPMDALQMILNMQQKNYLEKTGDTSNVLYDRLNTNQEPMQYQEGGQVSPDPLGIDARSANPLMYQGSIVEGAGGVHNPMQKAEGILSQLQLLKTIKDMESPENFKNIRKEMDAPSNEEIMKALDFMFKAREAGVSKFQSGGYVPEVGGPTREDVEDRSGGLQFLNSSQFQAFDPEAYGNVGIESSFQDSLNAERDRVFGGDPVLDRERMIEEKARENQKMLTQSYIDKDRQKRENIDDYFQDQISNLEWLDENEMTRNAANERRKKRHEADRKRYEEEKNKPWYHWSRWGRE